MPRQPVECPCCALCYACHLRAVGDVPYAKLQGRCEACAVAYLAGYFNACGAIPVKFREFVDMEWLSSVAEAMRGPSTKQALDEKRSNIKGLETTGATG